MAATRGRYGDGAVYQTEDGAWRGTVDLGRDPTTGRRIRKYVRGKSKGEVNRKIAALRDKHRAGEITVQSRRSLTLAEWLDQWLAGPAKLRLGEDMQKRYAQICRDHIKPTLGAWPLDRLSPEAITLLAQAGVPRDIVALVVGHDDAAFTERVYTHIDTETAGRASSALQEVFVR